MENNLQHFDFIQGYTVFLCGILVWAAFDSEDRADVIFRLIILMVFFGPVFLRVWGVI